MQVDFISVQYSDAVIRFKGYIDEVNTFTSRYVLKSDQDIQTSYRIIEMVQEEIEGKIQIYQQYNDILIEGKFFNTRDGILYGIIFTEGDITFIVIYDRIEFGTRFY